MVVAVAGVDEVAVDAGQRHAFERHAGAAHDPGLHGDVVDVVGLDLRGRLDLDHAGAPARRMSRSARTSTPPWLKVASNRVRSPPPAEQAGGVAQGLPQGGRLDEHAARLQVAGHLPDLVAHGEQALGGGRIDDELGAPDLEPEALGTLAPGHDARLGKTDGAHRPILPPRRDGREPAPRPEVTAA